MKWNWSNSNSVQRSYKPPQRQWCFHEFFSLFVLKKEEAACAWSFKTDMMWILRVQTCSSGARARVWKYRLWSFKFENTKSIRFSSKSEVHSLISFDMKWWQTYTIRAYFNEINFFKYKLSTWKLHQKWKLYFYIAWQFTHDILYGLVFD